MHCIGLVESAAIDADTQVGSGGKGETRVSPMKQEAHGAGDQGCQSEDYGQGHQEAIGSGDAQDFDEWLGCRKMEYAVWVGQDCEEWEDSS